MTDPSTYPRTLPHLTMPRFDGYEVRPGITLLGEPTPIPGTDKMRCLANVGGALGLVELRLKFLEEIKDANRTNALAAGAS